MLFAFQDIPNETRIGRIVIQHQLLFTQLRGAQLDHLGNRQLEWILFLVSRDESKLMCNECDCLQSVAVMSSLHVDGGGGVLVFRSSTIVIPLDPCLVCD